MKDTILVVGATGTVGKQVAIELAKTGAIVRAATRDPETAIQRSGFPDGILPVRFDLEQENTFDEALSGVDRVFLMARPGDEESDKYAFPLIDAMARNGIKRVVDLSAMGAELRPDFALRRIELRLESSPMAWTHLRPNWFMQVFTAGSLLATLKQTRSIRVPAGAAKISWVDARDVASVAAATLGPDNIHEGKAYTLTGGEALDHAEIASLIESALGIPVKYLSLTDNEARIALKTAGFPPPWVERLITFYSLVRTGYASSVSPSVGEILHRPPITMTRFIEEYSHMF